MEMIMNIIKLFNIEINIKKSLKLLNNCSKIAFFASVSFMEIQFSPFNMAKYIICVFHLITLIIITLIAILFIKYDSIFSLIDNEFLPKYTRNILMVGVVLLIMAIACRIDILISEWNGYVVKVRRHRFPRKF